MKKSFKRISSLCLTLLLTAAMLISCIPLSASAAGSGAYGDNITWYLSADGTLTISGTGDMESGYNGGSYPWSEETNVKKLVVEDGVESIGDFAFWSFEELESTSLPGSVESIGEYAFQNCAKLRSISIPDGVTAIESMAFYGCSSLTSITLPEGFTSIGDFAFGYCTSLKTINIPSTVTDIGQWAFEETPFLANYPKQNGFIIINDCLVAYTGTQTSVTIPDNIKTICANAFGVNDKLQSVIIPNSVTKIDKGAFYCCTALKSIVIPDSVESLGNGIFMDCTALTEISFPKGIKTIGNSMFAACTALESISIPEGVTTIEDAAFVNCSGLKSVTIPDGVESIMGSAFSGCTSLESITIPAGVELIGHFAFGECSSLKTITFEGDAPEFSDEGNDSHFYGVTATAYYPKNNKTWTSDIMQNYGGTITWVASGEGGGSGEGEGTGDNEGGNTTNPPVDDPNPGTSGDPVVEPEPIVPTQFKDVPADAYYADAVAWAVEMGITQGMSEDEFAPNASCTRAQAVTFLWRAAGSPVIEGETGFDDVPENAYYANAVKWAVANGITQGTGNGKFSPNMTCDRAQIVTFMYRAEGSPAIEGDSGFGDVDSDDYYSAAVQWAVQNGITQGTSADSFSPDNDCVRAQIVTFLYRAYA